MNRCFGFFVNPSFKETQNEKTSINREIDVQGRSSGNTIDQIHQVATFENEATHQHLVGEHCDNDKCPHALEEFEAIHGMKYRDR